MVCGQLKILDISKGRSNVSGSKIELDFRPLYGLKQLFRLHDSARVVKLAGFLYLVVLFESCRYLVYLKLSYIEISKEKHLYRVPIGNVISKKAFHRKFFLHERGSFGYEDLKSNFGKIIQECKELRERTQSQGVWN